jgi:hypothetical protein
MNILFNSLTRRNSDLIIELKCEYYIIIKFNFESKIDEDVLENVL